jgi:hypothetical protein
VGESRAVSSNRIQKHFASFQIVDDVLDIEGGEIESRVDVRKRRQYIQV